MVANTFFKVFHVCLCLHIVVMMPGIHVSLEVFPIDVLTALKSPGKILFGASSEASSAIVTTIWGLVFSSGHALVREYIYQCVRQQGINKA